MAKILISYGDERFKNSLKRIGKEAKNLGIFDKIILYTPKDLPDYIKASPLMAYKRLGGYAVWKSYIIYFTYYNILHKGDVLVYVDAGCTLKESKDWDEWLDLLKKENRTIVFQYRSDYDYGWHIFGDNANVRNGNWMKKSCQEYFSNMFVDDDWLNCNKLWSGALLLSKGVGRNEMLDNWFTTTLLHPFLSIDVYGREVVEQEHNFVQHRHDQTLLSIFVFYYVKQQDILILQETSESSSGTAGIIASRIRDDEKEPLPIRIRHVIHKCIGDRVYYGLKEIKNKCLWK